MRYRDLMCPQRFTAPFVHPRGRLAHTYDRIKEASSAVGHPCLLEIGSRLMQRYQLLPAQGVQFCAIKLRLVMAAIDKHQGRQFVRA